MICSPNNSNFWPRYAHFNFLLALCSRQIWLAKNWCDSHMHFSAGTWNFRPTNIPMESPFRSPKRLHPWKCIQINSPKSFLAILFRLCLQLGSSKCVKIQLAEKLREAEKGEKWKKGGAGKRSIKFFFKLIILFDQEQGGLPQNRLLFPPILHVCQRCQLLALLLLLKCL